MAKGQQFVDDVVGALRSMAGLRAIQSFLKKRGLQSGRSWDEITASLRTHVLSDESLKPDDLLELVADLRSRMHKQIALYKPAKELHERLWRWATSAEVSADLPSRFPFAFSDSDLETLAAKPVLVARRDVTDGVELFFTSARVGKRVDVIDLVEIAEDYRKNYTDADRVYAERVERRQAFDVVFVPKVPGIVQVRVDAIATTNRDGSETALDELEKLVVVAANLSATFKPVNLFPAIRSIYEDDDAGRVVGLQFDCSTGANRREVMRKIRGNEDLRTEPYHFAGVETVDITLYWLVVQFKASSEEDVEITLPGTLRHLQQQQRLSTFEISTFVTAEAMIFAVDTVIQHAKPA